MRERVRAWNQPRPRPSCYVRNGARTDTYRKLVVGFTRTGVVFCMGRTEPRTTAAGHSSEACAAAEQVVPAPPAAQHDAKQRCNSN